MKIMEVQFQSNEKPPRQCSFCDEDRDFLMAKPTAYAIGGTMFLNINQTETTLWLCLECLELELDLAGVNVTIEEWD